MNNFKTKLKHKLLDLGITQKQLADKMGVHKQVIANWLSGKRNPKRENVKKLAEILDLPISFFYEEGQKNFENFGIIGNRNTDNNFNADLKDIKIQLQDHEIRLLKLENEILKKKIGEKK